MSTPRIVLASGSERRRVLLESAGIPFSVVVPNVPESVDPATAEGGAAAIVRVLAERKARAAQDMLERSGEHTAWILGADTLVEADHAILGKPATVEEARGMLDGLSGRTHRVWTGLALIPGSGARAATEVTRTEVDFRPLSPGEIEWYAGTGEWVGAAGGYRIQERGALLVLRIAGSYSNVVGLPLETFYGMLISHRYRFP